MLEVVNVKVAIAYPATHTLSINYFTLRLHSFGLSTYPSISENAQSVSLYILRQLVRFIAHNLITEFIHK
ncbi:MAG: hypothetical protein KME23_25315 [Goleter apudmare HA4340-LM2]|nr:hypothetical protein [Goleter apudmare HA4340-LM2]